MKIATHTARTLVLTLSAAAGLLAGGCTTPTQDKLQWGYTGTQGPAYWGQLSPDCITCDTGLEQSPIDIPAGTPAHAADIAFTYHPTALNILNNSHAIQVNTDPGSSIFIEGTTYNLLQFHFHALSEHTFAGKYADAEVHFVHQSADGEYAVVGVLLNRGAAHPAYDAITRHAPAKAGNPRTIAGVSVSLIDMLPADRSYYRYDGSFTTPPCTEGVKWFVMANPVEMSDAQLSALEAIYNNNSRPIQPLNNRTLY